MSEAIAAAAPIVGIAPIARTFRPSLTYYHANARGTGSAVKFELHPAHEDADGSLFVTMANQKTVGSRDGVARVFPTFDWENSICVKFGLPDIAQLLEVFRGMSESVGDGKGLFHCSASGNSVIKFDHRIDPHPAYLLEISRKPPNGGEVQRSFIAFSVTEALGLSLAIEQSLGVIAFGIPMVIPRLDAPARKTEQAGVESPW